MQQMSRPAGSKIEEPLRTKLVSSLRIRSGRDQNGMAGPLLVDLVEGGVVLGDDKHPILMPLPGDAYEPVVEEGEVGLADGADDDGAVLSHRGGSLGQSVVPPSRERPLSAGGGGEEAFQGAGPGEKDAEEEEEGEEGEEASAAGDGHGSLAEEAIGGAAGGDRVRVGERFLLLLPLMKRRHRAL